MLAATDRMDASALGEWLAAYLTPITLLIALLIFALLGFALLALARALLLWLLPRIERPARRLLPLWKCIARAKSPPGLDRLRRRLPREGAELGALTGAGIAVWGSVALFLNMVEAVIEPETLAAIDLVFFEALQVARIDAVDRVMVIATELGGAWVTVPVIVAVALWLAWRRHWRALSYWLGAALAARLSVMLLKGLLARERPSIIYSGVEEFSFPSGHATTAMILYGFLAFLLGARLRHHARLALYAGAATLVAAIGLSRLYLGVHWLSDVGAGFALGFAWVALLALAFSRLHPSRSPEPGPLAVVVGLALLGSAGVRLGLFLPETLAHYQQLEVVAPPSQASRHGRAILPPFDRSNLGLDPRLDLLGRGAAVGRGAVDGRANDELDHTGPLEEAPAWPAVAGVVSDRYDRNARAAGQLGAAARILAGRTGQGAGSLRKDDDAFAFPQPFQPLLLNLA